MKRHFTLLSLLTLCSLAMTTGCDIRSHYNKYVEVDRALEFGNAAFTANRFDEAIKHYDRGLAFAPGEPALLLNKSVALRLRGVEGYNASLKLKDASLKAVRMNAGKLDLENASLVAGMAVDAVKRYRSAPFFGILDKEERLNALSSRAESMRLVATVVDRKRADEALAALHEYIENEPDMEKKLMTQLASGKMLIETFKGEQAVVEYKKILSAYPDNIEALLGTGMALAQSNDSARFYEAKRYLKSFIERAPAEHPQMSLAKEIFNSKIE